MEEQSPILKDIDSRISEKREYSLNRRLWCDRIYFQAVIFCNGDVSYCCLNPHKDVIGNIRDSRLVDIWRGGEMQERMYNFANGRKSLIPLCSECEYTPVNKGYYYERYKEKTE